MRERKLVVISLGAGVQSSTMALKAGCGEFPRPDCAIFADTGYEPKSVYIYLDYLKDILQKHSNETNSNLTKKILENFVSEIDNFVQVCPKEMLDKLDNPITLKPSTKAVS